jgi:hypothetical protein
MLKAKVNLALVRDPRISPLDVSVTAKDGAVTLSGDVDAPEKRRIAEEVARTVDGVRAIDNRITSGARSSDQAENTTDFIGQKFLDKLEAEWDDLPEKTALAQADYLKWAIWMIYKIHLPNSAGAPASSEQLSELTDTAIRQVSRRVESAPALVALELQRVAELADPMFGVGGPELPHADLNTSPRTGEGNTELAA